MFDCLQIEGPFYAYYFVPEDRGLFFMLNILCKPRNHVFISYNNKICDFGIEMQRKSEYFMQLSANSKDIHVYKSKILVCG